MEISDGSHTGNTSLRASMPLGELMRRACGAAWKSASDSTVEIADICHDSRVVHPGALFAAVHGTSADGAAFIAEAVGRGAVAVVADRAVAVPARVALVIVPDAREAVSRIAAALFGLDAIQARGGLRSIGITGTNGKTTTAYMLRSILRAAGKKAAMWGTIEYDLIVRKIAGGLTTPDPVELIRQLVEAHQAGAEYAVMEVSSHSLDQQRTAGISFSAAVFTNLSQDHLDYHGTLEAYLSAKRRLFDGLDSPAAAIVNADESAASRIVEACRAQVLRFGLATEADVSGTILSESSHGGRFLLKRGGDAVEIETALVGRHNIINALAASAAALALGLDLDEIRTGIAELQHVPGRLQRVATGDLGFDVFVDYAHTDDALRNVLGALRPLTRGRLCCVFGCGGDRDRRKRPLMARAVAGCADRFTITSDNPRMEDPSAIIADIERGLSSDLSCRGATEPDRAKAIASAVREMRPGDTLLIAGKGHEDYQILGGERIHFDDVEVARAAIQGI